MPDLPASLDRSDVLAGRLQVMQPVSGHRAGTDALLLAAFAGRKPARQVLDFGAGVGTAGLALACLHEQARVTLAEREPLLAALAAANIAANHLAERVRVVRADVTTLGRDAHADLAGTCDLVIANPPFHDPSSGRASPDPLRASAHVMPDGDLGLWCKAAARVLAARGRLVLIHRADAALWLVPLLGGGLGGVELSFVHPRADEPAARVLVQAVVGSRARARILPPVILHVADGRFTEAADRIHRLGLWPSAEPC